MCDHVLQFDIYDDFFSAVPVRSSLRLVFVKLVFLYSFINITGFSVNLNISDVILIVYIKFLYRVF